MSCPYEQPIMRLVHVVSSPASLGLLKGQLAHMRSKGFDVHLVCSPDPKLDRFGVDEGIHVHPVEIERPIAWKKDFRSLTELTALFRRIRPDVVHANFPKSGLLGIAAAAATRVPLKVYHLRGLRYETAEGNMRRLLMNIERGVCAAADVVLSVSASVSQQAQEDNICSARKMVVVGHGSSNGVDATGRFTPNTRSSEEIRRLRSELGIPTDAFVIGFVGRLVRTKGIGELAAVWRTLRDTHPMARLLLVGPFDFVDPVPEELRKELESDPRVHLTGQVTDPAPYYALMDVLGFPSHREGFPNTVLEAAAMEVPALGKNVTGVRDAVVHNTTGLLFEDAPGLFQGIERYIKDPNRRTRHGRQARQRVLEHFQPRDIWQGYEELYRSKLALRG